MPVLRGDLEAGQAGCLGLREILVEIGHRCRRVRDTELRGDLLVVVQPGQREARRDRVEAAVAAGPVTAHPVFVQREFRDLRGPTVQLRVVVETAHQSVLDQVVQHDCLGEIRRRARREAQLDVRGVRRVRSRLHLDRDVWVSLLEPVDELLRQTGGVLGRQCERDFRGRDGRRCRVIRRCRAVLAAAAT